MTKSKQTRIYFYDNLKFILILLVVIGHFIQFQLDFNILKGLFLFIYSFHMPLFIFVTGFFAKKIIESDTNKRLNKILSYFILYIVYKILLFLLLKYAFNEADKFYLFTEMEPPWYLLACVVWVGISGIIKNVKPKYVMIVSILLSVFISYDNTVGDVFCLSRVIVFFPFFLLGYYAKKEKMEEIIDKLHTKKNKVISFLFIALVLVLFIRFAGELYFLRPIFTGRNAFMYIDFPVDLFMTGAIFRILCLLLSFLLSLALMSLIPKEKCLISKLGARTLQVYVLHYFIAVFLAYSTLGNYLSNFFGSYYPIFLIVLAILTTFVLSIKFFEKPFTKIFKLDFKKIYNN